MRIVALLPLKAHSARVPGKNFKPLAGHPLFDWILRTLLALPEVAEIVINTDARAHLTEAGLRESPRILLRDRQPELCGDFVSMNRVLADDIAAVPADVYVMTHVTNPLLRADTIRAALRAFNLARLAGKNDSLFAVNRHQARFYHADASPVNHDPQNLVRTQDLAPYFEENSNLYLFTAASFAATQARIGHSPLLFETPRLESWDIDDPEGWRLAEIMATDALRRGEPPWQIHSA
jgi:CMP-N-acetylneuraminic acid synthetase